MKIKIHSFLLRRPNEHLEYLSLIFICLNVSIVLLHSFLSFTVLCNCVPFSILYPSYLCPAIYSLKLKFILPLLCAVVVQFSHTSFLIISHYFKISLCSLFISVLKLLLCSYVLDIVSLAFVERATYLSIHVSSPSVRKLPISLPQTYRSLGYYIAAFFIQISCLYTLLRFYEIIFMCAFGFMSPCSIVLYYTTHN